MSNQIGSSENSYGNHAGLELTLQHIKMPQCFVMSCEEHGCL